MKSFKVVFPLFLFVVSIGTKGFAREVETNLNVINKILKWVSPNLNPKVPLKVTLGDRGICQITIAYEPSKIDNDGSAVYGSLNIIYESQNPYSDTPLKRSTFYLPASPLDFRKVVKLVEKKQVGSKPAMGQVTWHKKQSMQLGHTDISELIIETLVSSIGDVTQKFTVRQGDLNILGQERFREEWGASCTVKYSMRTG